MAITKGGSVAVRASNGNVGFAGLATCGSVWACPVCNARIMAQRQVEIGTGVDSWGKQGGTVAFGTMTMRHSYRDPLDELWPAISKAWGRVTGGKGWITDKKRHGVAGWLRVVEITWGRNGWHVHIHFLMFFEPSTVPADLDVLKTSMFNRWAGAMRHLNMSPPLIEGQDLHMLDGKADEQLARYFTKAVMAEKRIGIEMTSTQTKQARGIYGTRSVWGLLDDILDEGDADALALWHEYQRVSKGKRQMTWSKGMRDRLDLKLEQTDEEIAAEEVGSKADDLVIISAGGWTIVVKNRLMVPILEVVERSGRAGLILMLDSWGIDYVIAGEGMPSPATSWLDEKERDPDGQRQASA